MCPPRSAHALRRPGFALPGSFLDIVKDSVAHPVWPGLCTCPGVSGVTGSALRETSFINRSLAALADVLGALAERRGHVPYRNSKLTHFLQDVLGKGPPPGRDPGRCPTALSPAPGTPAPPGHVPPGDFLAPRVTVVLPTASLGLSSAPRSPWSLLFLQCCSAFPVVRKARQLLRGPGCGGSGRVPRPARPDPAARAPSRRDSAPPPLGARPASLPAVSQPHAASSRVETPSFLGVLSTCCSVLS